MQADPKTVQGEVGRGGGGGTNLVSHLFANQNKNPHLMMDMTYREKLNS